MTDNNKSEYWLHVSDDGREHHYDSDIGGGRTHHVTVKGDFEYVENICIGDCGHWNLISSVRPHGEGWQIFDSSTSDHFTVWRRRRKVTA